MFYTKGTESLHFYFSSLSMAYYTLCFLGDFKEVRGGRFEVFVFFFPFNDCIFMERCWMALGGLSVEKRQEALC